MLKVVVFDWDGTLADSVTKIILCKQHLAQKFQLPLPTAETIKSVLGTNFELALKICFPTATQEILRDIKSEFHLLMQTRQYQADLFPGAKETLKMLKSMGIMIAIATSKNRSELKSAIAHHQLIGFFDLVCCSEQFKSKPDPEMLRHIMFELSVMPEECLMVGDTTTDLDFANRADVKSMGVSFGAHSIAQLQQFKPYAIVDSFNELRKLVEELCISQKHFCKL